MLLSPEIIVQTWRSARKTVKGVTESQVRTVLKVFDPLWNARRLGSNGGEYVSDLTMAVAGAGAEDGRLISAQNLWMASHFD